MKRKTHRVVKKLSAKNKTIRKASTPLPSPKIIPGITDSDIPAELRAQWNALSLLQRAFILAYFSTGGNAAQAAKQAGCHTDSPTDPDAWANVGYSMRTSPKVAAAIQALIQHFNITVQYAGQLLYEALHATETKFFQHEGRVIEEREVIAWGVRVAALDMLNKQLNVYKPPPLPSGFTGPLIYLPEREPLPPRMADDKSDGTTTPGN